MLRWMQKSEALLAPGLLAVLAVAVVGPAGAEEAGEAAGSAITPEFSQGAVLEDREAATAGVAEVAMSSLSWRREASGPWDPPGAVAAPRTWDAPRSWHAPGRRGEVVRRERLRHAGTFAAPSGYAHRSWAPPVGGAVVLEHRRTRSSLYGAQRQSYLALKGGGLRVGEDSATDGLFLGFEVGGSLENVFEIGFSADYYYRSTENTLVHAHSDFQDLPLQVVESDHTSAHLLPLGVTMRLRLPVSQSVSPFVSGTLAYEMLFLENVGGGGTGDPLLDALAEDETFTGFGWQAAAGLGIRLAPTVGLFGEAGYHWGSPSQGFVIDGIPVDLKVDMDGAFVRGGLRFDI